MVNKKKIIIFSGGSGTNKLSLEFFKKYSNSNFMISYVINCYDNGKSTGDLRKLFSYQILGSSDVRKLHQLQYDYFKKDKKSNFFSYRFNLQNFNQLEDLIINKKIYNLNKSSKILIKEALSIFEKVIKDKTVNLKDVSFANIIYSSLSYRYKSMIKSEKLIRDAFKVPFRVYVNSDVNNFLSAINKNNVILEGEEKIVNYKSLTPINDFILTKKPLNKYINLSKIQKQKLFLYNKIYSPLCSSDLKNVINESNVIVYGPGTLYSSIYPTLATKRIASLISNSKAKKFFITNYKRDNDIPKFTQNDHIDKAFFYLNNRKYTKNPNKKYIDILFCSKNSKFSMNYLSCNLSKLSKFNFKKIIYENVKKINLLVVKKSLYS